MLSEKMSSTILWLVVIILVGGIAAFFNWRTGILQEKIDRADGIIAMMKLEHEAARIAANDAKLGRQEVYEQAREKLCRAETALGNNSVFCDMPIPDDLRVLWDKPDHAADDHIQSAK